MIRNATDKNDLSKKLFSGDTQIKKNCKSIGYNVFDNVKLKKKKKKKKKKKSKLVLVSWIFQ